MGATSGGNITDKLGLARNIISLHWKGSPSSAPDAGIYESILSGYTVYLKENVDRYISLKNSLCDYLNDFAQKSAKLADTIGDNLQKNFLAFFGFFMTSVLLKAVTERDFAGLFPAPLQILAWGLIAASLIHGIVSACFSYIERKRVLEEFNLLRKRYGDLLHKSDLDRILNEDEGRARITKHLDRKLKLFFVGWAAMLLTCAVLVLSLRQTMPISHHNPGGSTNSVNVTSVTSRPSANTNGKSSVKVAQPL